MFRCFGMNSRTMKNKYGKVTINAAVKYLNHIYKPEDKKEIDNERTLYVILPYFNFCKSRRRYILFMEFLERVKKYENIKIVISEATNTEEFDLPNDLEGLYSHHGYKLNSEYWCKENLINLAVKQLPLNWKYIAWIDADLTFLNENWVSDTIEALKDSEFVQLFETAIHMGPHEEAMKIDKSFGYMHKKSNTEWRSDCKYGYWHCGFAWACNRYAYDKTNGLIDYSILGSGDYHMAMALINKVEESFPREKDRIHPSYYQKLKDYEALIRIYKIRLSYTPGTILHHWHGRREDRKYVERWNILYEHNYNPDQDIEYDEDGLLNLSNYGKRMEMDIMQYFIERREDNMII